MNWRTTAVLFIILLLLGGYLVYQKRQADDSAAPDPASSTPLPPTPERFFIVEASIDNLRGVNVTRLADGAEAQFIQEDDGDWVQMVPTSTLLISSTMNLEMSGLTNLRTNRSLRAEDDGLSAYGLDAPAYRLSAAVTRPAEGQTVRITMNIGSQTPAGDAYYIQVEGDPRVHLVPVAPLDNVIALLDAPPIFTPVEVETAVPASDATPETP